MLPKTAIENDFTSFFYPILVLETMEIKSSYYFWFLVNPTHIPGLSLSWIVSPELPEREDFEFLAGAYDSIHIVKQYQLNSTAESNVFQTLGAVRLLAASVQEVVNSECSGRIAVCPNLEVEELQKLTNEKVKSISITLDYDNVTFSLRFMKNVLQIQPEIPLYQLAEGVRVFL